MSTFVLTRMQLDPDVTIGELRIGGVHVCWTVEDAEREVKIKGETCIPRGKYQIKRTWSNRFQQTMPQLMDVPNFEGIRIHPGNTAHDTEGCILPGMERRPKGVGSSQLAYREILKWLDAIEYQGLEAWVVVTGPEAEAVEP